MAKAVGRPVRILFLCGKNRLRSPTAEEVFSGLPGHEVASAGIDNDADERIGAEHLAWADVVLAMERSHLRKLRARFKAELRDVRTASLDIPDRYAFMQPELVRLLQDRVPPYLR